MKKRTPFLIILTMLCVLLLVACSVVADDKTINAQGVSDVGVPNGGLVIIPLGNTVEGDTQSVEKGDIILGDVNGDGQITNADVLMIYRYIYNPELYPIPSICRHNLGSGDSYNTVISATCSEEGYTLHRCKNCDYEYRDTFTEKADHEYGPWSEILSTCTAKVLMQSCIECENSLVKIENGTWHEYTETVVEPTCVEQGYTLYQCDKCRENYKDNYVDVTEEHIWQELYVITSTCAKKEILSICTVCHKTEIVENIPTVEHEYENSYCTGCGKKDPSIWDGTIGTGFAGGSGTAEDPYLIANGEQLAYLAYCINSDRYNTLYDKHYKLINDIDLGNIEWDPIGCYYISESSSSSQMAFRGVFDGDGHTVSNLKITSPQKSYYKYFGLFGMVENATVKNLDLINCTIDLAGNISSVGCVAGEFSALSRSDGTLLEYCTVTNCYATGEITLSSDYFSVFVGGVSGILNGDIKDCHSMVEITVENAEAVYVGGIAGSGGGSVCDSSANGKIVVECSSSASVGGLIGTFGMHQNTITNCHTEVSISCTSVGESESVYVYAGGLLGVINLNNDSASLDISNCYATGNVNVLCDNLDSDYEYYYTEVYVGGLIGCNKYDRDVNISSSYATGKVNAACTGNEKVYTYAGGFIGDTNGAVIENCYSSGSVYAECNGETKVYTYAGGFIGNANKSEIINCYSVGDTVVSSSATSDETVCFSGFVGNVDTSRAVIRNCYCLGNANANATAQTSSYIYYGKIVTGGSYATIENTYYFEEQTIEYTGGTKRYKNSSGISCTLSQLQSESFYTSTLGWDSEVWDFSTLDFEKGNTPVLK